MTTSAATGAPPGIDLSAIDLSDLNAFGERVPYEWFDLLRRADPVHWQPERCATWTERWRVPIATCRVCIGRVSGSFMPWRKFNMANILPTVSPTNRMT